MYTVSRTPFGGHRGPGSGHLQSFSMTHQIVTLLGNQAFPRIVGAGAALLPEATFEVTWLESGVFTQSYILPTKPDKVLVALVTLGNLDINGIGILTEGWAARLPSTFRETKIVQSTFGNAFVFVFPREHLAPEAENLLPVFDTRKDVWWLKRLAPNTLLEVALGTHPAGYYNPMHYQLTQTEVLILLRGKIEFGKHTLSAGEAIISPPLVPDDERVLSEDGIMQLVIKTCLHRPKELDILGPDLKTGGRDDKVVVGSERDLHLRAAGLIIADKG
jgi:hypothetical protein